MKIFVILLLLSSTGFAQVNSLDLPQNAAALSGKTLNGLSIKNAKRLGDVIYDIPDKNTGETISAAKVATWFNGKQMNDSLCDGVIFFKTSGGEYFKRNVGDYIDSNWFPLHSNGNYDSTKGEDDSETIRQMIEIGWRMKKKVFLRRPKNGLFYRIDKPIVLGLNDINIEAEEGTVLNGTNLKAGYLLYIVGNVAVKTKAVKNIAQGQYTIDVSGTEGLEVGDWIKILSAKNYDIQRITENVKKSEISQIVSIDRKNNTIKLNNITQDSYDSADTNICKITFCENLKLKNVTFKGKGTDAVNLTLLQLNQVKDAFIENCSFIDNGQSGVQVINGYNVTFTHCTTNKIDELIHGDGIVINGSYFVNILDCFFSNGRHGVDAGNLDVNRFLLVQGCKVVNMLASGLSQHGGGDFTTFSNNQILNCGGGIINRSSNFTAIGNTIAGNSYKYPLGLQNYYAGILIGDGVEGEGFKGKAGIGLKLMGNTIQDSSGSAISVLCNLTTAIISGNICKGFKWSAFELSNGDAHSDVIISDNIFDCSSQVKTSKNWMMSFNNCGVSILQTSKDKDVTLNNFIIKNNIFKNLVGTGIKMKNGSKNSSMVIIENNILTFRGDGSEEDKEEYAINTADFTIDMLLVNNNKYEGFSKNYKFNEVGITHITNNYSRYKGASHFTPDTTDQKNRYLKKQGSYTLTTQDYCVDLTANTAVFTLPTASGIQGQEFLIKNSGKGVLTLKSSSGQNIDAATTVTLTKQYSGIGIISDGQNWKIVQKL